LWIDIFIENIWKPRVAVIEIKGYLIRCHAIKVLKFSSRYYILFVIMYSI